MCTIAMKCPLPLNVLCHRLSSSAVGHHLSWDVLCLRVSSALGCPLPWDIICHRMSSAMEQPLGWYLFYHRMPSAMGCYLPCDIICHWLSSDTGMSSVIGCPLPWNSMDWGTCQRWLSKLRFFCFQYHESKQISS